MVLKTAARLHVEFCQKSLLY